MGVNVEKSSSEASRIGIAEEFGKYFGKRKSYLRIIICFGLFVILLLLYPLIDDGFQSCLKTIAQPVLRLPISDKIFERTAVEVSSHEERMIIKSSKIIKTDLKGVRVQLPEVVFNIRTHFYVPIILTISLILVLRVRLSEKVTSVVLSIVIYFLLFWSELFVIIYQTLNRIVMVNTTMNSIYIIEPENIVYNFFSILNKILNTNSNLSTRGLVAIIICFITILLSRIILKKH